MAIRNRARRPSRAVGQRRAVTQRSGRTSADAYIFNILQPEMWLKLRETSIAQPNGNVADNAMYTLPESLVFEELFSSWGGAHPGEKPTGWSDLGTPDANHYIRQSGAGFRLVSTDGGAYGVIRNVGIIPGDTYRVEAEKLAGGSGDFQYGLAGIASIATATGVNTERKIATQANALINRNGVCDVLGDTLRVHLAGQLDGSYSGPTLAGDTFLGFPCPTFDGVNDFVQLEHNRLESVFNPDLGSVSIAAKLSSAQWQDANQYAFMRIGVDDNNRIYAFKGGVNLLRVFIAVGGVSKQVDYTVVAGDYGKWLVPVFTFDKVNNRLGLYIKNTLADSDTYPAGTWTASNLAAASCRLGSNSGFNFHPGSLANAFVTDYEMAADQAFTYYNSIRAQEPNAA